MTSQQDEPGATTATSQPRPGFVSPRVPLRRGRVEVISSKKWPCLLWVIGDYCFQLHRDWKRAVVGLLLPKAALGLKVLKGSAKDLHALGLWKPNSKSFPILTCGSQQSSESPDGGRAAGPHFRHRPLLSRWHCSGPPQLLRTMSWAGHGEWCRLLLSTLRDLGAKGV